MSLFMSKHATKLKFHPIDVAGARNANIYAHLCLCQLSIKRSIDSGNIVQSPKVVV